MSDDIAFRILRTKTWRPQDLQSSAQRELQRGTRLQRFAKQFERERRDPMTTDLVGWDENLARNSPWPWCHRCKNIVRAYGVEERESRAPIVWARCHGNKQAIRIEKPHPRIDSDDPKWLQRRMRHLVFFAE